MTIKYFYGYEPILKRRERGPDKPPCFGYCGDCDGCEFAADANGECDKWDCSECPYNDTGECDAAYDAHEMLSKNPPSETPSDTPDAAKDMLGHPEHYTRSDIPSGIECWDHYELAMTNEEFRGAMKNNLYKYIFRAGHKDPSKQVEDLEKCIFYLKRWIRFEKGERVKWSK